MIGRHTVCTFVRANKAQDRLARSRSARQQQRAHMLSICFPLIAFCFPSLTSSWIRLNRAKTSRLAETGNPEMGLNLWFIRFVLLDELSFQQQLSFPRFSSISPWLSHLLKHNDNRNLIGLGGISPSQLRVTVNKATLHGVSLSHCDRFSLFRISHSNIFHRSGVSLVSALISPARTVMNWKWY